MFFEVTLDKEKWESHQKRISGPCEDIYFTHEYHHLYEVNGDGEAWAALYEGDNGCIVLYPFLKRRISGYETKSDAYDIKSCYGYGGPTLENYNHDDFERFEELFLQWCRANGIVAEFIRFHPLLDNHLLFKRQITTEKNRDTVFIDLGMGLDDIWNKCISGKNRNMIRRGRKLGLTVRQADDMGRFRDIYLSSIGRLNADDYYYFSGNYFDSLSNLNGKDLFILEAWCEDRIVAASMFMYYGKYLHYHLAGSDNKYLNYSPNNILIFEAISKGVSMGLKKMHLGGGRTREPEDPLFKFKKSFSSSTTGFYIGKRIHDQETYTHLMSAWSKKHGKTPALFLQYEKEEV